MVSLLPSDAYVHSALTLGRGDTTSLQHPHGLQISPSLFHYRYDRGGLIKRHCCKARGLDICVLTPGGIKESDSGSSLMAP